MVALRHLAHPVESGDLYILPPHRDDFVDRPVTDHLPHHGLGDIPQRLARLAYRE